MRALGASPSAAVVVGGGPAWAAALELALMLKEIARIPAEGVETREGATSAMFGLDRGHLMVSLDPEGDPLGDEALRLCAATGATTLRLPGVAGADARLAPVTTLPAAAALAATLALAAGHDVDHPAWTDAYYETARSADVSIRLGVVGCGSVFWTPYMSLIERLRGQGRVEVTAVYDADPDKRRAAAERLDLDPEVRDDVAVCAHPDVDVVLVLTSMTEHGRLARAALEAGKHVLVEKPVATSLAEAEPVLAAAEASPGLLVCAPHILLSPTYRAMHARVRAGEIGGLLTARARYGWAGPDWSRWYYEPGGGALFDLGVYNVTSLCGFFGPARRVTAMTGVAIPERVVNGRADARRGRGQRARADRLRRRALRGRHDRLHDAELPLALPRAVRHARRAADARRRLGARGLRAVATTTRAQSRGSFTRSPTPPGRGPTGCATWSSAWRPAPSR